MPLEPAQLQMLIQGGSWGVLVAIIVWFGWKVIPRALEVHQQTVKDLNTQFAEERKDAIKRHDAELERRDVSHETELKRRDEALQKVVDGLAQTTTQLGALNDKIDDLIHSPTPR